MKLKNYITLSTIIASSATVVVVTLVIFYLLQVSYHDGLRARGLELARVIAHDPHVIAAVEQHNQTPTISHLNAYIESIRQRTDASYIVVVDKQALRLSHPNTERLNHTFIGDDIYPALRDGGEYSTFDTGSLGLAVRNFSAIEVNGEVIGVVCIGYLADKVSSVIFHQRLQIGLLIATVYLLGLCGISAYLYKFKQTFFDYEPEFIVNKFREYELVFNSIRDGIVVVDKNMHITMINDSACQVLSMREFGRDEYVRHPLSRYSATLNHLLSDSDKVFAQHEVMLGNVNHHVNIYPLNIGKVFSGYVITFFVSLTPNEMEKELAYLRSYSALLRSKTHEYSNRLNVLSGMLQMGNYQQAIEFVQQETDRYQLVVNRIVRTIADSAVAGILLAKFNKAEEMGVKFTVDADSSLAIYDRNIAEKLVTINANLIDNALLAAWQNRKQVAPRVSLYISDRGPHIIIEVEDSGSGIPTDLEDKILDFGVSSKQGNETCGIGLYLVNQLVEYLNGSIDWERSDNHTTIFSVYLDKKECSHGA